MIRNYFFVNQKLQKTLSFCDRIEKIRIGREERRQKYDLAEEKREVFRSQIRQKYGIKSKEESDNEKVFIDFEC